MEKTPEEIKKVVVAECERLFLEDSIDGMMAGNPPEREWGIKLKEGISFKCYEDKPADSAQWIFLYRLLGLAERDLKNRVAGVIARWRQPFPDDPANDPESNLYRRINKTELYLNEIWGIVGDYEPQLATS